jgi:hypothetical protein
MSIVKKYLTEALVNEVLQSREQLKHKGMVLSHDPQTDRLKAFKIRY